MRIPVTVLAVLAAGLVSAQQPTVTLTLPKNAKAGQTVKGTVEFEVPSGWHAYANPATSSELIPVAVTKLDGAKLKHVTYPKGKTIDFAGKMVGGYEGKVSIPIQFAIAKNAKSPLQLKVTVHYQMCNDQTCGMPADVVGSAKLVFAKKKATRTRTVVVYRTVRARPAVLYRPARVKVVHRISKHSHPPAKRKRLHHRKK